MKDLHNNIEVVQLLAPVAVTATGAITDIDLAGWNSAELIIDLGADSGTELSATDYKIIKCSEYQLAGVALPYDIVALHTQRQALRDQIAALGG